MTVVDSACNAVGFASITGERAAASLQPLAAEELEMEMGHLAKLWRSLWRDPDLAATQALRMRRMVKISLGSASGKELERFVV